MQGGEHSPSAPGPEITETEAALRVDLVDLARAEDPLAPLEVPLSPAFIDRAMGETDARAAGPGRLTVRITVQSNKTALVQGTLDARLVVPCARCLADAEVDAGTELTTTYVPADRIRGALGSTGEDEEIELEAGDLDELPYQGNQLDLRPLVEEQLGLAYPMRALCSLGEACAGLCAGCGQDLNARPPVGGRCEVCGAVVDPAAAVGDAADGPGALEEPAWKAKLRRLKGS